VSAAGVKVYADVDYVKRYAAGCLSSIQCEPNPLFACQLRQFLLRKALSRGASDVADQDQLCPFIDQRCNAVHIPETISYVRIKQAYDDPVPLHAVEETDVDDHVLMSRGNHLISLLERQAIDDHVDALGRTIDQSQVFATASLAQDPRQFGFHCRPQFLVVTGNGTAFLAPGPFASKNRIQESSSAVEC
jgi:hypothetical protein